MFTDTLLNTIHAEYKDRIITMIDINNSTEVRYLVNKHIRNIILELIHNKLETEKYNMPDEILESGFINFYMLNLITKIDYNYLDLMEIGYNGLELFTDIIKRIQESISINYNADKGIIERANIEYLNLMG